MTFLKDIMKKMGVTDEDLDKALSEAVYSIDTFNRYDFYYYPGVPVKIDFSRHIRIDVGDENNRREDMITISLL